jgi:hypothetical protein
MSFDLLFGYPVRDPFPLTAFPRLGSSPMRLSPQLWSGPISHNAVMLGVDYFGETTTDVCNTCQLLRFLSFRLSLKPHSQLMHTQSGRGSSCADGLAIDVMVKLGIPGARSSTAPQAGPGDLARPQPAQRPAGVQNRRALTLPPRRRDRLDREPQSTLAAQAAQLGCANPE